MKKREIVISIINFNGQDDTVACLESLDEINIENMSVHIVIVDNASDIPFTLKKPLKNISHTLLRQNKNTGFAGGHNIAIQYALKKNADYVLILNNDTFVHKNFLEELVKPFEDDTRIGITVPKIYFEKGQEFHKSRYKDSDLGKVIWYAGGEMDWENLLGKHRGVDEVDKGKYDKVVDTEFATGCCMLIKKEVFETTGFLDEKYFLYYEDTDFSERVKRDFFRIVFIPDAIIWHKNAGSSGGSGSALQDYFITRNRLLFGSQFAPIRTKYALFRESIKLLVFGRKWQKKGVMDFYFNKLGQGSYR